MSFSSSFPRFPDLPLELRLMIWEYALTGGSVFAAGCHYAISQDQQETRAHCSQTALVSVGPVPNLAGFACVESRRLLERFCTKLGFRHRRECNLPGVYWINMDRMVLYLDVYPPPLDVLRVFDAEVLSKLQHICFRWDRNSTCIAPITRACQLLAVSSPALRTIIIQLAPKAEICIAQPVSLTTAAYYSTIPDYEGPELGVQELDCMYVRAYLLVYFVGSAPKLHIIPPASHNGSA